MKNYSETTFTFGKYRGKELSDINDLCYLEWILNEVLSAHNENTNDEFIKNLEIRVNELQENI